MPVAPNAPNIPGPTNRLIQAIFWPVSVWPSFTHMEEHAADDYVGRTTPILGTAIGFWICAVAVVALWIAGQAGILARIEINGIGYATRSFSHSANTALGVLMVFLPLLYVSGFWMFASREDDYPN